MSLLLDALKRAEQEKLARQEERTSGSPSSQNPAGSARLELEALDGPRTPGQAPAGPAAASAATAAAASDRGIVQSSFAAKQTRQVEAGTSSGRLPLMIGAVAIVLLVLAGGGYFWYQIAGLAPSNVAASRVPLAPRPLTPGPVVPAPPAAIAPTAGGGSASGQVTAAPPVASAPPPPALPSVAVLKPEAITPDSRKARPAPGAAEQLVMDLLKELPAPSSAPLRLARTLDAPRVHPDVALGYDALKRGDIDSARRGYQAALTADPTNADALLGLATAEARGGDRAAATRHYRRALEIDPRNATALAGLAALADLSRPQAIEPQLRSDIARYPESAALHFTLGNLYASQARWADAQTAYFEAHRIEPGNADILHNLAVSLDNLGQSRLAADYYRRALAATRGGATQFDARAVERRLAELKP